MILLPVWFIRLLEWRKRPAPKPKRKRMCGWTKVDGVYRSPSHPGVAVHGSRRCWFRTDENGMCEFTNFHAAIGAPLHFPAPLIPPSSVPTSEGIDPSVEQ